MLLLIYYYYYTLVILNYTINSTIVLNQATHQLSILVFDVLKNFFIILQHNFNFIVLCLFLKHKYKFN